MKRWNRGIMACSCLCLVGYAIFFLYPFLHTANDDGWNTLVQSAQRENSFFWFIPLVFVILLWLMIEVEIRQKKHTQAHGSAHHATRRETKPFIQPFLRHISFPSARQKTTESRLVLGRYQGEIISLTQKQQESNVLLTAPIGAGKSSKIIIPNLLRETGKRSLFISDVKGELVRVTAGALARKHEIWGFSPMNPEKSTGYNPLAFIHSVEDAQEFATCWIKNTGESKDDFWPNTAKKLMTATLLHLQAAEPNAPFSRVADILCTTSYEDLKRLFAESLSPYAKREVKTFFEYIDLNPKLIGSVMTDLNTRFQLLSSDQIRDVTARNEIDFAAMAVRPIALYMSIPRRYAERYQPLLACFMMQMFACWEEEAAKSPTGQLARGIACYLDEFANLGYIPNISGYISTARSSRIALLIVLQSFNQIDEKYGQEIRKTMLSNTTTHLLLPGAGLEETEYYSQRIGNTTIPKETRSTAGLGFNVQDATLTQDETGRRLFMPDELRTMPEDAMLMINATSAPMVLKTTPYFREKLLQRLVNLPYHPPVRQQKVLVRASTDDITVATEETPPSIADPQDEAFLLP